MVERACGSARFARSSSWVTTAHAVDLLHDGRVDDVFCATAGGMFKAVGRYAGG